MTSDIVKAARQSAHDLMTRGREDSIASRMVQRRVGGRVRERVREIHISETIIMHRLSLEQFALMLTSGGPLLTRGINGSLRGDPPS